MNPTIQSITDLRLIDLVLDPQVYHDTLIMAAHLGQLAPTVVDHLLRLLPQAIDQLDAVGDLYGALALAGVYDQLMPIPVTI